MRPYPPAWHIEADEALVADEIPLALVGRRADENWWTPERMLFLAVLDQWVCDACSSDPQIRRSAYLGTTAPYTRMLEFACQVTGLDFSVLRAWVAARAQSGRGTRVRSIRECVRRGW